MKKRYLPSLIVSSFVLCSFLFSSDVAAEDFNVIADSPVSVVIGSGEDVTFDWHLRTSVTQTKFEIHTNKGTRTIYSSGTQYTWENFPYGYGWWWVKVYRKGWFNNYKWYGQTSINTFHNSNTGSWTRIGYLSKFQADGRIQFFELQRDYTIDLTDYFWDEEELPDCCEDQHYSYLLWALDLPPCDWDFVRLDEEGILTIKQGYRWDGASYPCKKFLNNPCIDDIYNIRSSLVHDSLYDLMRMEYLIWDPYGWFCEDKGDEGYHNRKMADMLLYMIGIDDGQWKEGYFHAKPPLKGRGAEPDWDLMRGDAAGGATCNDDKLTGWKYHVSELTATASDGKVELNWKPANDSGRDPRFDEHFLPLYGYLIERNGFVIALNDSSSSCIFTDDTVVNGNTYTYRIRPHPANKNQDDYSNTAQVTVTVDNVAPAVDAGPDETINEGDTLTGSGSFTDLDSDTWTATVDYGDGSGVYSLTLTDKTFSLSHIYADDGLYTVIVMVTDDDGGVGTDTALVKVKVNNVAPAVDAGLDDTINEGDTFTGSGSFTDPDSNTWTATVDYGDESGIYSLPLTDNIFDLSHIYADNGVYTVTVTVTDSNDGVGIDTVQETVNNVAPSVDAGPGDTINEGDTFTGSGSFTDPGADTWTATVDYGDGSGVQSLTLTGKIFDLSHFYADSCYEVYTVTVTVTDNDDGVGTDTVQVTVVDDTAPIISLNGSAIVILECGVDSYTEEGATATDNCDENVEVVIGGDTVDTSTCGTYLVTYDATDDSGNPAEQAARTVIVQDTLPPEFSLSVEPNVLWPVNHKMFEITPSWVVSDNCDEWPDVSLVSITMNEDAETKGGGNTIGDIFMDANDGIQLRAERRGKGTGRVYTITYQAVDDSNNVAFDRAAVAVPHDQRRH